MRYCTTILLCLSLFIAGADLCNAGKFKTVILDAGHGGRDKGAVRGRVYEKHLALDTTMRVNYLLRKKGYSTRLTRKSDVFISLAKRAAYANRYSNAIFVAIHYNYTYKSSIHGIETFYYGSRSKPLAGYILSSILRKYHTRSRGLKRARFYVLRHTKHPACLVECGFLSNSSERKRCMQGWYRQRIAEGIVNGIVRYQYARSRGRVR